MDFAFYLLQGIHITIVSEHASILLELYCM